VLVIDEYGLTEFYFILIVFVRLHRHFGLIFLTENFKKWGSFYKLAKSKQ